MPASIPLPAPIWQPPDGTTGNLAPGYTTIKGTQTPAVFLPVWQFDGASSVEGLMVSFVLPNNYSSGGTLRVLGMINSTTSGNVVMQCRVGAVTPGDADTPLEHAFAAAATVTIANNTAEARRLLSGDINLTMDSATAGDLITLYLFRDPAHTSDTITADFEFLGAEFQYVSS